MINKDKGELNLEDLDYIKSIESVNRYMHYGLSGNNDSQEKILHFKCLQNKFSESQDVIEKNLNVIETIADNHPPNRKKGALFEKKDLKQLQRFTRRRNAAKKIVGIFSKHNASLKHPLLRENSNIGYTPELSQRTSKPRKSSIMSKNSADISKSHISKDFEESFEKTKIDYSLIKHENKVIQNKFSNMKLNSILKKSNDNLFLTKIDKKSSNEIVFEPSHNNQSYELETLTKSRNKDYKEEKGSNQNTLQRVSFDELSMIEKKLKGTNINNSKIEEILIKKKKTNLNKSTAVTGKEDNSKNLKSNFLTINYENFNSREIDKISYGNKNKLSKVIDKKASNKSITISFGSNESDNSPLKSIEKSSKRLIKSLIDNQNLFKNNTENQKIFIKKSRDKSLLNNFKNGINPKDIKFDNKFININIAKRVSRKNIFETDIKKNKFERKHSINSIKKEEEELNDKGDTENKSQSLYKKKHLKNKSHFDIVDSITKVLNSKKKKYESEVNSNLQSFIILDGSNSELINFDKGVPLEKIDPNSRRIRPKILSPELDKPKHNNSRQSAISQIFLKNFMGRCKNQQQDIGDFMNDISTNIVNTNDYYKNDTINLVRKIIGDELNYEIDKEVFMMDNRDRKKEKKIILRGPGIKGENKYLFEDKNSPIIVGEIITKLNEKFANDCRDVLKNRLVILNSQQRKKRDILIEEKQKRIDGEKSIEKHKQIEISCNELEKIRTKALKERKKEYET